MLSSEWIFRLFTLKNRPSNWKKSCVGRTLNRTPDLWSCVSWPHHNDAIILVDPIGFLSSILSCCWLIAFPDWLLGNFSKGLIRLTSTWQGGLRTRWDKWNNWPPHLKPSTARHCMDMHIALGGQGNLQPWPMISNFEKQFMQLRFLFHVLGERPSASTYWKNYTICM